MIVLGIDPGYAIIGYGVLDTNKQNMLLDYGAITTPKEDSMPIRLENIDKSLKYLFDKFKPVVVAIEELFYFKNQKTVIQVASGARSDTACLSKILRKHLRIHAAANKASLDWPRKSGKGAGAIYG